MNANSVFIGGTSHNVCQDYALAGVEDQYAYAIVSDGCSSAPHTDIGSRVLTLATKKTFAWLQQLGSTPTGDLGLGPTVLGIAKTLIEAMDVTPQCLSATLLSICADNESYRASMFGDGVFLTIDTEQTLTVYTIGFAENFPDYLSYGLDPAYRARWEESTKGKDNYKTLTKDIYYSNGEHLVIEEILPTEPREFILTGSTDGLIMIAAMSDGVESFEEIIDHQRGQKKTIKSSDIFPDLLAFKNFQGDFVDRRAQRFLQNAKKQNWEHYDDFSMAAIYFGS